MRSANLWRAALREDWEYGGFGLYIHWPFCQAKCPYCDFNSHVVAQIDQSAWATAYLTEIERIGAETKGRILRSVFFGGGTPSMMDPDLVDTILTKARATWGLANDIEITLEANPTSVEAGRFAGYRDAGVNRVSMGIQALNDASLKALGRLHTAQEALAAFDVARSVFDRVSFDLIYARQDQTVQAWQTELKQALTLAIDHISLYQLTIEKGTAFGDRYAIGKLNGLPDEDSAIDMFETTQKLCDAAGFASYEISNHAKLGQESRHNKVYWQYGDYAGIGPGAHGRLTLGGQKYGTEALRSPGAWLKAVSSQGHGETPREKLSTDAQAAEFLLMGLRLNAGVALTRLQQHSNGVYDKNINMLVENGLLEITKDHLRTTAIGRPLLNAILREILAD